MADDPVNHPAHYIAGRRYEPVEVIVDWQLSGNVVKYISRARRKGDAIEDLRKAAWYLAREIRRREDR